MNFEKLTAYMDSLPGIGVPSADIVVYRDHEQLYRHSVGFRDEARTQPLRGDETYRLYSCSKVFTTCAAMQLIQAGKLSLDDPVSRYLPAYANLTVRDGETVRPAARTMTVRHLMSMQSGLNYDMGTEPVKRVLAETDGKATTRQLMEAKAEDPLCFEPGTDFLYSLSHDALAAVIEAVSGQKFSDYLREHIWGPLGLNTMSFDLTDDIRARLCMQYAYDEAAKAFNPAPVDPEHYRISPNYESGGGGLFGDLKDYSRFVDALACGGESADGVKILAPEMLQLWNTNQLGPKSRATFDQWRRLGYSYALGVRTRVDLAQGGRGQIGEFGWDGAAGAWAMIDPYNRLSAFFVMHVLNYSYCFNVIHPTLRDLIYGAVK